MNHRSVSSRLTLFALLALMLTATIAAAAEKRVYTDEELATMPAPGPNPWLSYLPVGAEVDWDYWHAKRDYENRQRAEAQEPPASLINVVEVEPNNTLLDAQAIPGFGTGAGDDAEADVTGTIDAGGDVDCFSVDLEVGDILGVNLEGSPNRVEIFSPAGDLQMGSSQDASFIYPPENPLPRGGVLAEHITYEDGGHFVCASNGTGAYTLELRAFRSVFEDGGQQILFVDFDGATIDPSIFGGPAGDRTLSPLSSFLAGWGLGPADEDAVIDAIMASVFENMETDLEMASNANFGVEILNSRDHADPFGQPNVSRLIVGGSIAEFGIGTIGIAQSIDPGNFGVEESAVILLDLLSAPAADPNSLNQFGLGGGATIIDLVGVGVGNITAHEAGHYLGNFHTEQFAAASDPSIMDQGGNLPGTVGVGDDLTFGTADDFDTDFSPDLFNFGEGFTGTEFTDERTAHALTAGSLFTDGFESGNTTSWSVVVP
ncbi:MAG: hypothetical protein AAF657_02360 [Acidobacteriota bacterium]